MSLREVRGLYLYKGEVLVTDLTEKDQLVALTIRCGDNPQGVSLTLEEARFLAQLLIEAADRKDPQVLEPTPPKKAPPAPQMPKPARVVWTPERDALLAHEVGRGTSRDDIYTVLNRLPGPMVPNKGQIGTRTNLLGLRSPAVPLPVPAPPVASPEPVVEAAAADPIVDEVPVVEQAFSNPPAPLPEPSLPKAEKANGATVEQGVKALEFDQVKALASRWGVPFTSWDDLPGVNARCERLGHPRIERKYPVIPRRLHLQDSP